MRHNKTLVAMATSAALILGATSASAYWSWDNDADATTAESKAATAAVADALKKEQADCANGADGTVGASIQNAMRIHTKVASTSPNVEDLFDINDACFSGLLDLFDLSVTIPSFGAIVGQVQSAMINFAKRKVCTAIQKEVNIVNGSINDMLKGVGGMQGITDLNGLTNGQVQDVLTNIDTGLGGEYNHAQGTTYEVNTNALNAQGTTYQTSTPTPSTTTGTNSSGTTGAGATGSGATGANATQPATPEQKSTPASIWDFFGL